MTSCLLGLVIATATVCPSPAQSQSSLEPAADTTPAATHPAPASRTPNGVMAKLSDLVHAGKDQEAQQLTAALLLAYPDDQRLLTAKAWLDKAVASAKPAGVAAPGGTPPASSTVQPAVTAPSAQLTGMDKIDYNALMQRAREARQTTDLAQQKTLLKQFMDESRAFLQKHPEQTLIWQLRADSALDLDDVAAGFEAGQKLLAAGAADSNDPKLQNLLAQLKSKGWLDEQIAKDEIAVLDYTAGQNHTVTLPKAVTLDLIWIAPGTFMMGSPDSETGRGGDEGPQTAVTISQGFWLGKTLVTQGQYQAIMGENPSYYTDAGPDARVDTVSWNEAKEFCRKLTEQEHAAGHLPEGYVFTLPTEAQWEYACRAGTTGARYGNVNDIAWYIHNGGSSHPVAQKQPNAWGLYDMNGTVWEQCSDWGGNYPGGNVTDPVVGPDLAPNVYGDSGPVRVARGGSVNSNAASCRSASRCWFAPGDRSYYLGFRLALSSVRLNKAPASAQPADVGLGSPSAVSVVQAAAATVKELDRISTIPLELPPWNDRNHNTSSIGGLDSGTPKEPGDYFWIEKDRVPVFEQVVPKFLHATYIALHGHCLRILETYSSGDGRWFRVTGDYGLRGWPTGAYGRIGWIHESAGGAVFTVKPHHYVLRMKFGLMLLALVALFLRIFFWRAFFRR